MAGTTAVGATPCGGAPGSAAATGGGATSGNPSRACAGRIVERAGSGTRRLGERGELVAQEVVVAVAGRLVGPTPDIRDAGDTRALSRSRRPRNR